MKITHVVAMDINGGIGRGGSMPWGRLPNELAHFRRVTSGQVMVMGRKTVESLPTDFRIGGRELVMLKGIGSDYIGSMCPIGTTWINYYELQSTINFMENEQGITNLMICGGAQTYSAFPPDEIIATVIQAEFECDTHYPFADLVLGRTDGEHVCSGVDGGLIWDAWRFKMPIPEFEDSK